MTINTFSIEYDAINSSNSFTSGDVVKGRIVLETSKDTKVQSLTFTGQGKAHVAWSESSHRGAHSGAHARAHARAIGHHGRMHGGHGSHFDHRLVTATEKYYEIKQHILRESRQDGTEVLSKGRHVFPFSFQIPDRQMPSSFKSMVGKIVHKVTAELRQSMKFTKKAKAHLNFVSKADLNMPGLMQPQRGCVDKSPLFGSGVISLDIQTPRMAVWPGETLQVTAEIGNESSRSAKPKFVLYEKQSYVAQGCRRVVTSEILRDKVEVVSSSSKQKVIKTIAIPPGLPPCILNCSIIKLEYRLKVFLDIKCATDPEVKLPVVVMPPFQSPASLQQQPPNFAVTPQPPAWGFPPPQPPPYYGPPPTQFGAPGAQFGAPAPQFGGPYPDLSGYGPQKY